MTGLSGHQKCESCDGLLVPPIIAPGFRVPEGTDYVCLTCGRPYRWVGDPPRLMTVVSGEGSEGDE
jgi:hypothetical protein